MLIQMLKGQKVHECVAGDTGNGVGMQLQLHEGQQVYEYVAGDVGDGIFANSKMGVVRFTNVLLTMLVMA